jgi:hypothetical protein
MAKKPIIASRVSAGPKNGPARDDLLAAHLERLADSRGRITPARVVENARPVNSLLHDRFEWDDAKAAELHRLDQARVLIASVEVQIIRNNVTTIAPAWVRDPDAAPKEQGYVRTVTLRDDHEKARENLLYEAERAAAVLTRVRTLAVAVDLEGEVDPILERFSAFRERVAEV